MDHSHYEAGDTIYIEKQKFGKEEPYGEATVVARLPVVNSLTFYRVRFDGERFERKINSELIARGVSTTVKSDDSHSSKPQSSWINMSSIKTKKRSI